MGLQLSDVEEHYKVVDGPGGDFLVVDGVSGYPGLSFRRRDVAEQYCAGMNEARSRRLAREMRPVVVAEAMAAIPAPEPDAIIALVPEDGPMVERPARWRRLWAGLWGWREA